MVRSFAPRQVRRQVQQGEEAGIEGAEHALGGEIGDAFAHRLQRRLQDGGLVGARLFGGGQADIVAHQQGGGDQQDAQGKHRRADGEGDFQIFDVAAMAVALGQQPGALAQHPKQSPAAERPCAGGPHPRRPATFGRTPRRAARLYRRPRSVHDQALTGRPGVAGRNCPGSGRRKAASRRHPAAAGLVGRQEFRLAGQQETALAGLGVQRIAEDQFKLADHLIGVADPALGRALIGGKLEGEVGA